MTGKVSMFSAERGYGFLSVVGERQEYFVHWSAIVGEGYKKLEKGQDVSFDVEIGPKGKPQATQVRVIESEA